MGTDAAVLAVAVTVAHIIRVDSGFRFFASAPIDSVEWLFAVLVVLTWMISLAIEGVWAHRFLGTGGTEYRRILVATAMLFSVVGVVGFLAQSDLARGYLLVALPIGVLGLLFTHWLWWRKPGRHQLTFPTT